MCGSGFAKTVAIKCQLHCGNHPTGPMRKQLNINRDVVETDFLGKDINNQIIENKSICSFDGHSLCRPIVIPTQSCNMSFKLL